MTVASWSLHVSLFFLVWLWYPWECWNSVVPQMFLPEPWLGKGCLTPCAHLAKEFLCNINVSMKYGSSFLPWAPAVLPHSRILSLLPRVFFYSTASNHICPLSSPLTSANGNLIQKYLEISLMTPLPESTDQISTFVIEEGKGTHIYWTSTTFLGTCLVLAQF